MNFHLAQALIQRGIINTTTRIIAKCPITAMGNAPTEQRLPLTVERIFHEDNDFKFIGSHRSGRKFSIPASKVELIDGMSPTRLAAAFDIKADGLKKSAGKKRGRKPKEQAVAQ